MENYSTEEIFKIGIQLGFPIRFDRLLPEEGREVVIILPKREGAKIWQEFLECRRGWTTKDHRCKSVTFMTWEIREGGKVIRYACTGCGKGLPIELEKLIEMNARWVYARLF